MPWVGLHFVIEVFPDHTHFLKKIEPWWAKPKMKIRHQPTDGSLRSGSPLKHDPPLCNKRGIAIDRVWGYNQTYRLSHDIPLSYVISHV